MLPMSINFTFISKFFLDLAGVFDILNKSLSVLLMHEAHLLKNILKYFEDQEKTTSRKIKKVYFSISEFGSLDKEHFLKHYQQAVYGTRFQGLEIAVNMIPFGPELEITGLELVGETEDRKK